MTLTCVYVLELLLHAKDNKQANLDMPKCRLTKSMFNYEVMVIKVYNKLSIHSIGKKLFLKILYLIVSKNGFL